MKSLIQKLVETAGPPGYEAQIRTVIRHEIESHADQVWVDALGNLIARKDVKNSNGMKIMLAAHMDEIGIIVTHIEENGFARFTSLGGIHPEYLAGGRVRFLDGAIGVINMERRENPGALPALEQMYLDLGATSRKTCPVRVADVAVMEQPFLDMGARLVSKAMDDRVGAAVLIETLQHVADSPHELYFVFSVQEEVGIRGATTAAYAINPDLGIAIDVTRTGDTPNCKKMEVSLGKGPAIKVRDGGMLSDPRVVDWMVRRAESAHIPYQLEILEGGTTDARAIQIAREGVPAGCLSIPCRYVHAPSEMVDYGDVQDTVRLLAELLSQPIDLK